MVYHVLLLKYFCEKLTATFTSQGMSQLIKGSFYPVLET